MKVEGILGVGMTNEVIKATGRYIVVTYERVREGRKHELRYLVLDRQSNSVVGAPFGYPDSDRATAFARELDQQALDESASSREPHEAEDSDAP